MQTHKKRINANSVVKATSEQVSSTVDGEEVILNLESGSYYGLDAVGARIWTIIQEPISITDLVDQLVNEYDVTPERCEAEVVDLMHDLHENKLLEINSH